MQRAARTTRPRRLSSRRAEHLLAEPPESAHTQVIKKPTLVFYWVPLVAAYKMAGGRQASDCAGRVQPASRCCQRAVRCPAGAVFTQGRMDGGSGMGTSPVYSLAMAKGFSTSILPQSAMVTSFRGLSRPSVLVLSTCRTTS